jgi:hypothetical protein
MSYYPKLSATQVRNSLNDSVVRFDELAVTVPGIGNNAPFSSLSISGGLINAARAVELAESLTIKTK